MKTAQELFEEQKAKMAARVGLLIEALKHDGMEGFQKEIIKQTRRPLT